MVTLLLQLLLLKMLQENQHPSHPACQTVRINPGMVHGTWVRSCFPCLPSAWDQVGSELSCAVPSFPGREGVASRASRARRQGLPLRAGESSRLLWGPYGIEQDLGRVQWAPWVWSHNFTLRHVGAQHAPLLGFLTLWLLFPVLHPPLPPPYSQGHNPARQ